MAMLGKTAYEAFAQSVARGTPVMQAYMQAGYQSQHASAATALIKRPEIAARVAELRGQHMADARSRFGDVETGEGDKVSIDWIARNLSTIALRAMEGGAADHKVAIAALESLTKIVLSGRVEEEARQAPAPRVDIAAMMDALDRVSAKMPQGMAA